MNLVPAVNVANGPLEVTVDGVRQGGRRIVAYSDRLQRPEVSDPLASVPEGRTR